MATKIGEMREALMEAMDAVRTGEITPAQGMAVAKIAGAISSSLQVEVNALRYVAEKTQYGHLAIGEETILTIPAIEHRGPDGEPIEVFDESAHPDPGTADSGSAGEFEPTKG